MSDIVERLRGPMPIYHAEEEAIRKDAAAEIERLREIVKIIEQDDANRGPSYPASPKDYCFSRCIMPELRGALAAGKSPE